MSQTLTWVYIKILLHLDMFHVKLPYLSGILSLLFRISDSQGNLNHFKSPWAKCKMRPLSHCYSKYSIHTGLLDK